MVLPCERSSCGLFQQALTVPNAQQNVLFYPMVITGMQGVQQRRISAQRARHGSRRLPHVGGLLAARRRRIYCLRLHRSLGGRPGRPAPGRAGKAWGPRAWRGGVGPPARAQRRAQQQQRVWGDRGGRPARRGPGQQQWHGRHASAAQPPRQPASGAQAACWATAYRLHASTDCDK